MYPTLVQDLQDADALGFLPGSSSSQEHNRTLRHVYMSATARRCGDCGEEWAAHVNLLTVRPQCQRCFTRWCEKRGGVMRGLTAIRQYLLDDTDVDAIPTVFLRVDGEILALVARAHAEALAIARWGSIAALEEEKARRAAVAKRVVTGVLGAIVAAAAGEEGEGEEEMEEEKFIPRSNEPVDRRVNGEGVVADAVHGVLSLVGFPAKDYPTRPLLDDVPHPETTIICKFCSAIPALEPRIDHYPGYAELFEGHLQWRCPNLPDDFFDDL